MLKGVETVVYYVEDLAAAAAWYRKVLEADPVFESEYYVGFDVCGHQVGLHPVRGATVQRGSHEQTGYWTVDDVRAALAHFLAHGASEQQPVTDVGDGIELATVQDPFGNPIGLIHNPHTRNH